MAAETMDWNDPDVLASVAMIYIGLTREQFFDSTPLEIFLLFKINNEKKRNEFIATQRAMFESMRLQTLYLINIQLERKDRYKHPEKLMPFEWDQKIKSEITRFTDEEGKRLDAKLKRIAEGKSSRVIDQKELIKYI